MATEAHASLTDLEMFKWAAGILVGHRAGMALLEMFPQLCNPEPEGSLVTRGNAVMWGGCDPGGCDPLSETCVSGGRGRSSRKDRLAAGLYRLVSLLVSFPIGC